jgi:hypothetical protein
MKKRKLSVIPYGIVLLFIALMHSKSVSAQLPVFTQFSQNQLNINPAFAGFIDDDFKFNALYRCTRSWDVYLQSKIQKINWSWE